ncbi:hypothetical protein GGI42DRAFT_310573 [Trichoderma sp. SZMC 28013]
MHRPSHFAAILHHFFCCSFFANCTEAWLGPFTTPVARCRRLLLFDERAYSALDPNFAVQHAVTQTILSTGRIQSWK